MTLGSTKKDTKKVFLTTKTKIDNLTDSKIDVIISPEFYWVRKFEIPVKTEAQARHVLPTLFEDIVNEDNSLTYQVKKLKENEYLCFAFNNKKVYDALKNSGLPISNIASLYFSQNECEEFKSFKVDELCFLYTSDGILVKVPNNIASNSIDLNKVINSIKPTAMKVQIKLYNDVLSGRSHNWIYTVFAILIVVNLVKYFDYNSEIKTLNDEMEKIKTTNKLPSSMIQTNSILNTYEKKIKIQKEKREAILYILSNKKFNLKSFSLDANEIVLDYLSVDKDEVESFLKKKFKEVKVLANSFSLRVSVKL